MKQPTATIPNLLTCAATRRDGLPCQVRALPGSAYCFAHDPARAEQRTAARRQGGRNRADAVRLRGLLPPRLVPIFERLEAAMTELHAGTLDPRTASAMAALARAMVAVLVAGETEQRLRDLEARLSEPADAVASWRQR
jgi:hypothetical protein